MIRTALTELVGIEHPVVCAGMGSGISDGDLAGAVSEAGGLGVIGASWLSADEVTAMADRTRELTAKPFGVTSSSSVPKNCWTRRSQPNRRCCRPRGPGKTRISLRSSRELTRPVRA